MRKTDEQSIKDTLDTLVEQVMMNLDEIAGGNREQSGTLYFEASISGLDWGKTCFVKDYLHSKSAQNGYFAIVIDSRKVMYNGESTIAYKGLIGVDLGKICSCSDNIVAIEFKPDYYYFYLSNDVERLLSRDEYYLPTLAEQ